jgi:hypothetical protein
MSGRVTTSLLKMRLARLGHRFRRHRVRGARRSSLRDLHRLGGGGANNMENKSCVVALQGGVKRQVWVGSQRGRQRTGFLVSAARRGVCAISF